MLTRPYHIRVPGLLLLLLAIATVACTTPQYQDQAGERHKPVLTRDYAVMEDGYRLPLASWLPDDRVEAVVLALHGFNDYKNAFSNVGKYLSSHGIATYAYDQRGFGGTVQAGVWPGSGRLRQDGLAMTRLLRKRYPDIPLYLVGESMGGAVVIRMMTGTPPPPADGVILLAPAVWGRDTMNPFYRGALWIAAHTFPAKTATGKGLDIKPSDNIEMLRALGQDPLVIKETRFDALYGLTNLMGEALEGVPQLGSRTLILYGERDEIIPDKATCRMLAYLPEQAPGVQRAVIYPDGYHMLTRDLQAPVVLADINAWIVSPDSEIPSGYEISLESSSGPVFCQ